MLRFAVCICALLLVSVSGDLAAQTTRYVDINHPDASDTSTCTNPAAPCLTISNAVSVAIGGDIVEIADGIYTESVVIDKSLSLVGVGRLLTIVQASSAAPGSPGEATTRVISIPQGSGFDISISEMTIRHGRPRDAGGGLSDYWGGGIARFGNTDGSLVLTNLTIRDNYGVIAGGLFNGNVAAELNNVEFISNSAARAGGMYNISADANLTNIIFEGNEAGTGDGGGMVNTNGAAPVLNEVVFRNNSAGEEGGGMSNDYSSAPNLTRVRFESNNSLGDGGGMHNRDSNPVLEDVVFEGNSVSGGFGGGLANWGSAPVLVNVLFKDNSASGGGAVSNQSSSTPELVNVALSGNYASLDGGAMYNRHSDPVLTNLTFSGNRSGRSGGAMYNWDAFPAVRNSIIWNNQDDSGSTTSAASVVNDDGSNPVVDYSLVAGCNAANVWNSACGTDGGFNLADSDPALIDSPDPSTAPTLDGNLRLSAGSEAIDAGNSTFVSGIDTDLDGLSRIFDGTVDLGPYEWRVLPDELFRDSFEM